MGPTRAGPSEDTLDAPPRIVVTGAVPAAATSVLAAAGDVWTPAGEEALDPDGLRAAVAGADAVLTLLHDRVDEAVLAAAGPQLKIVANVAVGFDNIDVAACARHGVTVTNTPDVLVPATADLAMALMLAVTRRLVDDIDQSFNRRGLGSHTSHP